MRTLNEHEKSTISALLAYGSDTPLSAHAFLQAFYFTEESGRALILQTQERYAVFFLTPEVADDAEKNNQEMTQFFELIHLLDYLCKEGYLTFYREKTEKFYFFRKDFAGAKAVNATIVLNDKGDYTASPETIHNKEKEIIYKGRLFSSELFELIFHRSTGTLLFSAQLGKLLEEPEKKLPEPVIPHNTPVADSRALLQKLCLLTGCFCFFVTVLLGGLAWHKSGLYDKQFLLLGDTLQQIQESVDSAFLRIHTTLQEKAKTTRAQEDANTYFYGVDLSKWNGNAAAEIDGSDSISFIICKATEGIWGLDPEFETNWKLIKEKSCLLGAYHFYHTDEDPLQQAKHFVTTLSKQGETDIPPIVDIEEESLPKSGSMNSVQLQNQLLIFLNYLEEKLNRIPMIYTDEPFANRYLLNPALSKYPLWLAQYTNASEPRTPITWKDKGYKIWQKSDNYFIDTHRSDFDVFHGQKTELYK